ncbi:hypothetical protein PC116_g108 [Phytophthora cactorum]|nr:hypothetical protein PC114_g215 [Phytophthora cactorum]KAG4252243.1 hypothetical protein PC116_g108 [Phytophthora cactorum]
MSPGNAHRSTTPLFAALAPSQELLVIVSPFPCCILQLQYDSETAARCDTAARLRSLQSTSSRRQCIRQ